MDILFAQVAVCAIFGLVTGLLSSLVMSDRENPWFSLICSILGTTVGVWFSVAWIFLTGGTTFDALMVFSVIVTTVIILMLVLGNIREIVRAIVPTTHQLSGIFAFTIIFLIAVFLLVSAIPMYGATINDTPLYGTDLHNVDMHHALVLTPDMVSDLTHITTSPYYGYVPMSIGVQQASVNFPFFKSAPNVGDYLGFDITFSVGSSGGDWTKPYVKVAVIHDSDNSGTLTDGDAIWGDYEIKAVTNSGTNWRSQVIWENGQPFIQATVLFADSVVFMPIFHASAITVWQNDNGKFFPYNTPEGYTAPSDQMSWESSGGYVTLKEDISTFSTIAKGQSSTMKCKLYCTSEQSGTNFIWVGAYDLNYQTQPFEYGIGEPLNSKTTTFTIGGGSTGPTVEAGGPYSGNVGQTITFTGSATGGTPPYTTWSWVFSDGTTKTGQSVTKSFPTAGSYSVTLTVTDSAGKTGTDTASITIGGGSTGPTVEAGGPYSGTVGQYITFTGSATGGTPPYTTWSWVFSDGTTKTGQSVTKSFPTAGSYTVALTVTDSAGKTGTDTAGITITGGGGGGEPDVGIDVATYVIGGSLALGCLGAIVYGRKYL